jgi:hypothetical protein
VNVGSVRRALVAASTAVLIGVIAAGPVAGSRKPVVSVSAAPSGTSVAVSATINRGPKQVAGCTYAVDGTDPVDCAAQVNGARKSSTIAFTVGGQASGGHVVSVTIALTDGGSDTGSDDYAIVSIGPFEGTCPTLDGGVYSSPGTDGGSQECAWSNGIASDRYLADSSTLSSYCGGPANTTGDWTASYAWVACR